MTKPLVLLTAIGVTSAAVAASTAQQMSDLVSAWVGHPVEELLAAWGDASEQKMTSAGRTIFTYGARSRNTNVRVGVFGGVQGGGGNCTVTFEINDAVVVAASWSTEGTTDREKSRRACWREFRRNKAD